MGHGLQADVPVSSDCIPGSRPKISRRMYLRSFTNRHPEPSFILHWRCDFSSYKRNAVLMTMQKAKVSLARQRHPTARDNRFGNPLANRLTLPYWKSKGEALSATRSGAAVMTGSANLNSLVERLGFRNLPLSPPPSVNAEPLQTQPRAKFH